MNFESTYFSGSDVGAHVSADLVGRRRHGCRHRFLPPAKSQIHTTQPDLRTDADRSNARREQRRRRIDHRRPRSTVDGRLHEFVRGVQRVRDAAVQKAGRRTADSSTVRVGRYWHEQELLRESRLSPELDRKPGAERGRRKLSRPFRHAGLKLKHLHALKNTVLSFCPCM